jgi:CheY-like chemotaxis protein
LRARDAQSALAIIESGARIDLLFTDVIMPGPVRSPELARKARERLPDIAILFTSGYTENAIVHGGRLDEGVDLLSKPYTREALAQKFRQVLRNQRRRGVGPAESRHALQTGVAEKGESNLAPRGLWVLLVEDETLIRLGTAEMLTDLGHSVREAANATEALAILDEREFDVLVTDLKLPGIPGDELAGQAIARQPGLRIVFASGYEVLPNEGGREGLAGAVLLQKPYIESSLSQALQAAMSAPSKAVKSTK